MIPQIEGYCAFDELPNAAASSKQIWMVTDVGPSRALLVQSDGERWRRIGSALIGKMRAAAAAVTGTTDETLAYSLTIPGGLIGPDGVLQVLPLVSLTNNANTKTITVKLGATTIFTATGLASSAGAQQVVLMRNIGSEAVQRTLSGGSSGVGTSTSLLSTTVDTSADVVLNVYVKLSNSADTIRLEDCAVFLL